jgi:hypothetical protein
MQLTGLLSEYSDSSSSFIEYWHVAQKTVLTVIANEYVNGWLAPIPFIDFDPTKCSLLLLEIETSIAIHHYRSALLTTRVKDNDCNVVLEYLISLVYISYDFIRNTIIHNSLSICTNENEIICLMHYNVLIKK